MPTHEILDKKLTNNLNLFWSKYFFHRHDYVIIDKTVLPSAFQQMKESQCERATGITLKFFQTSAMIVLKCSICKRTKIVKMTNFMEL